MSYIFFVFFTWKEKWYCRQKCLSIVFFNLGGISTCNYYTVRSSLWLTDKILGSTFQNCKVSGIFFMCLHALQRNSQFCLQNLQMQYAVFSSNCIPWLRYRLPSSCFPKSSTCWYLTVSRVGGKMSHDWFRLELCGQQEPNKNHFSEGQKLWVGRGWEGKKQLSGTACRGNQF